MVTTYGTVMSEMKSIFGGKEDKKLSLDNLPPLKEEALETGKSVNTGWGVPSIVKYC